MGMYTELILKAEVKPDLPDEVESVLQFLFNRFNTNNSFPASAPVTLPDHSFFSTVRWQDIGACNSYYHVPWSTSRYEDRYIFSRSDLKNYDYEIQQFLDWLTPYLDALPGDCIGWQWYEECTEPTLLYMPAEVRS